MSEQKERGIKHFEDEIISAYDLSSSGMGMQLHTVDLAHKTDDLNSLPDWAKENFPISNSNYIGSPSMLGWLFPGRNAGIPDHLSSHSDQHLRLFKEMSNLYSEIQWAQLREVLDSMMGVKSSDPISPITDIELQEYFKLADSLGLLERFGEGGGKNVDELISQLPELDTDLYDPDELTHRMGRTGVFFVDIIYDDMYKLRLTPQYREKTLKASTYKLGTMLAITEQILYDAKASAVPISASFTPPDLDGRYHLNWQKTFDEELPTIEDLATHAQTTLARYSDPHDQFVGYLLGLDITANFKR
jgi:hypothetical protein